MTLNNLIQTSRPTVTELLENLRNDSYFVDDSFQRRLVWTERQKVRLVQTMLMGYPMPEIYLWQQPANPDSGKQKHSIVDGQQRLTTMLQFTTNEWPLSEKFLDSVEGHKNYKSKYWKDLGAEIKQSFWQYVVNVRIIPTEVNNSQIVDVFRRLNETDKSLNPQELRNAEFNGEFIKAAERVTELSSFSSLSLFTDSQVRRMGDIEFVSGLLMFLRRGLIEENTKSINETYDLFNDEYAEASEDVQLIGDFLQKCADCYFQSIETRKFFTKPIHLYTLFCVERMLIERDSMPPRLQDRLDDFVTKYQSDSDLPLMEQYREGARSRTRSRASRNARIRALLAEIMQE